VDAAGTRALLVALADLRTEVTMGSDAADGLQASPAAGTMTMRSPAQMEWALVHMPGVDDTAR
jgi:hypothetical protein